MALPGFEVYIQPLLVQLEAVANVDLAGQAIAQVPCGFLQIVPRQMNPPLRRRAAQIDDDDRAVLTVFPAPGHQIPEARVVVPPGTLAQSPFAVVKERIIYRVQERFVEAMLCLVRMFVGTPAQKDRGPDPAPFELSFVEESGSRNSCRGERRGLFLCAWEGGRGTRFVMILDEADQLRLISGFGTEVKTHALRIAMFQAVIEPLVVAVVEAQLL